MTTSFRRLISSRRLNALAKRKKANKVARILGGVPEPELPLLKCGVSIQEVVAHRIAEIDHIYDPGWYDQRDVAWIGAHHARVVADCVAGIADKWTDNFNFGGWRNQPLAVREIIDGLLDRVEPALYAAEKEYDPDGWLRERYDEIEHGARATVAELEARFKAERIFANPHKRKKIRAQEAAELQILLDGLAGELQRWASYFPERRLS